MNRMTLHDVLICIPTVYVDHLSLWIIFLKVLVIQLLHTGPERNCSHFEFCIIQDIKYQKVKKICLLDYFQKFSGFFLFFLFFPAYHDIQHNNHTKHDSALLLLENPTHLNVLELTNKIQQPFFETNCDSSFHK